MPAKDTEKNDDNLSAFFSYPLYEIFSTIDLSFGTEKLYLPQAAPMNVLTSTDPGEIARAL